MRARPSFYVWIVLCLSAACLCLAGCPQGGREAAAESDEHAHAEGETEHKEGESEAEHAGHAGEHEAEGHEGESAEEHAGHAHEDGEEHEGEEGGHAGHDHAELIQLSPEQMEAYGVQLATAGSGSLELTLELPGEVAVNADTTGHVLPRLGGVVQSVTRKLGDTVKKGELLVSLDSSELARAKADYLAAAERLSVAEANAERERLLLDKGVSPEVDYLNAQNAVREAEIVLRAAEQTLNALGISDKQLAKLSSTSHESLTRYEVYAPISGRILEKHVSVGEMVSAESELFLIADLSSVWVNLNISQKDLPRVREGQKVHIRFNPGSADSDKSADAAASAARSMDTTGLIDYIDALVAEDTRTAQARVELDNHDGRWKPGMFVSALLSTASEQVDLLIPLDAVIKFEGQPVVFVRDDHGFEPRVVTLGRQSATHVEVLGGLKPGESYVKAGAYMVKAELGKSEAGHGH